MNAKMYKFAFCCMICFHLRSKIFSGPLGGEAIAPIATCYDVKSYCVFAPQIQAWRYSVVRVIKCMYVYVQCMHVCICCRDVSGNAVGVLSRRSLQGLERLVEL